MNYRIEKKEAFRLIGPRITTTLENDKALADIPEFWGKTGMAGQIGQLCTLMNQEPEGVFGVSSNEMNDAKEYHYYIAVASSAPVPEGMYEYWVPACTWAIFESVGPMPSAIQALQRQIYTEWLPTSGYDYDKAPDIEVYSEGDQQAPDYKSWVWLPVVKK